jgi:hypothetical protein
MKMGEETRYIILRPWRSLNGAVAMGPKPIPKVYRVRPRIATVREMLKSRITSESAGVYTDVPKVLHTCE